MVVLERDAALPLSGLSITLWPNAVRALQALGVGLVVCNASDVQRYVGSGLYRPASSLKP